MTITVKFFASLSELLGKKEVLLEFSEDLTLEKVWQQATDHADPPPKLLMAINMAYAKPEDQVQDNDEVAFFPPVTGGQA